MKVTFLVYNIYGMGGTVRTVVNTANYLAEHGYKVEIISIRRISEKPLFNIDSRIKIKPLIDVRKGKLFPEKMSFVKKMIKNFMINTPSILIDSTEDLYSMLNLFSDFKLYRALKKVKKGILITTFPSLNIIATKYVDNNVIKIGQEHKYFYGHSEQLQKKIKKYYSKLDGLTFLTDEEINNYKEQVNLNNVKLFKVENATSIPYESSTLKNKVVIAAGRYNYQKGFDNLIKAFTKVAEKHADWKLKIFGAGGEKKMYEELISEYKMNKNIILCKTSSNILKEMKEASIYALSSRYEPFGMVLIEAMSVGIPCVSFKCSGPLEIIGDGQDGFLVDEDDNDGFAEKINQLIEDEELRFRMGKNAKKNVSKYSLTAIGEKWEEIIKSCTKKA